MSCSGPISETNTASYRPSRRCAGARQRTTLGGIVGLTTGNLAWYQALRMSRRHPRVRVRFAATVQIAGVEHTLVCNTRDISNEGCFLVTSERIAEGVELTLALLDNERGEAIQTRGIVARVPPRDAKITGIGVRLIDPPEEWQHMVRRYQTQSGVDAEPHKHTRQAILVIGDENHRRGALALYVTSGWDVRFANDLVTAIEALNGVKLDAIIAEYPLDDTRLGAILDAGRRIQPGARRIVRTALEGRSPTAPPAIAHLVHRVVDEASGLEALLDALTAKIGTEPASPL